jgi:hypothetical protein
MRKWLGLAGSAALSAAFFASAIAADMPRKGVAVAPVPHTQWLNVFGGVAVVPDSWFADIGAVWAFDRNLDDNGWVGRIRGGYGNYEYFRAPGLVQSTDFQTAEIMLGYHWFIGRTRISLYGGPGVEHHASSDPGATVKGTRWGANGQVELFSMLTDTTYVVLMAHGSTAFDSYFTLAKVGFQVLPQISIGPEASLLGNERFDARRGGGFVAWSATPSMQVILSGGYTRDARRDTLNDHSGGYGTLHITSRF